MSNLRRAKIALAGASLFCGITIWGVHYQQQSERENMYQGVLKDDVRRKEKLLQRQVEFEESQRKRELYERHQRVEKSSP